MSRVEDNKRIAKNTIILYARMLLVMLVSLYTVRIVLYALGEEDYGIHNVVGGIVTMFSFLTSTMNSASQRFFAFEIGRKNYSRLNQYFNITLLCYVGISVLIIAIAETLGLWFLKNYMTIPANRMDAALLVYHLAILSFMINMWTIPYSSMIIAHERMTIYAYIGILEVFFKLVIAFILIKLSYDKLKAYAIMTSLIPVGILLSYYIFCRRRYLETKICFEFNYSIFKEVLSFSGWNLFGAIANVLKNQGLNILLNVFFNPVINAARAIALQIESATAVFSNNFFTAVRPQITKLYSSGETERMIGLVYRSTKLCFFLILVISIPVLLETPIILRLWLKEYPSYTVIFTRLTVIYGLLDVLSYSMIASVQATGKVKVYQLIITSVVILIIPISYLFLRAGYEPTIALYITLVITVISFIIRLYFMKYLVGMSIKNFLLNAMIPIMLVSLLSVILPTILHLLLPESFTRLCVVVISSIMSCGLFIYIIGMSKSERTYFNSFILSKLKMIKQ